MTRKSWLVEVDFEKLFHYTTLFLSPSNDEKGKKVCIELGFSQTLLHWLYVRLQRKQQHWRLFSPECLKPA
jgi:hypothetical protein